MAKLLAVFDFDHTIIDANSDLVLRNLLPSEVLEGKKLKGLRPSWTAYMAEVFRQLPLHGFNKQKILETCRTLEITTGIYDLFQYLRDVDAEIVILSDANSEIISTWLQHNLPFVSIDVVTNPAVWTDDVLRVKPYQQQISCKQCPINLCKGSVLTKNMEGKDYKLIVYVGDGKNDLCPVQKLRHCDLACPRANFTLEQLLKKTPCDVQLCVWSNGIQIRDKIREMLQNL